MNGFRRFDQLRNGQIVALYLLVWGESGLVLRETYREFMVLGELSEAFVSFHIPISLWSFHHLYMTHVLPCGSRGPCLEATCALCQRCFTSSRGSCIIPPGLVLLGAHHLSVDVKTAVVFEQFVEVRTWRGVLAVWRGCMRILYSSPTLCQPQVRPGRSNAFLVQVVRPIYKVWWVDKGRQLVHSFVKRIFWRSMWMPYTLGCKFASSS